MADGKGAYKKNKNPKTLNPKTLNLKSRNPKKPETRNPEILNPKIPNPKILNPEQWCGIWDWPGRAASGTPRSERAGAGASKTSLEKRVWGVSGLGFRI